MYQGEYSFNNGPWIPANKPRPTSQQAKADCKMVLEPNRAESSYYRFRVLIKQWQPHVFAKTQPDPKWVVAWEANPPHKKRIKWI